MLGSRGNNEPQIFSLCHGEKHSFKFSVQMWGEFHEVMLWYTHQRSYWPLPDCEGGVISLPLQVTPLNFFTSQSLKKHEHI